MTILQLRRKIYNELREMTITTICMIGNDEVTKQDMREWRSFIWQLMIFIKDVFRDKYLMEYTRIVARTVSLNNDEELRMVAKFLIKIKHEIKDSYDL